MRRAKQILRCQYCGERVGARVNYCGNCGAAIKPVPLDAVQPVAAPLGTVWPQHAEGVADPVDWPLPVPDEANAPLNIDEGIDQEPTIPSLAGPGSLIMPPPQPPLAFAPPVTPQPVPPAVPLAMPQAAPQAAPELSPEFAAEVAAQVAAQVAARIASTPQVMPAQAAAPLVASPPVVTSHPLATSTPLVMTAPSMRTRGRFLAALLELVTPGLGMMFLGSFWLGALVLVSTLFMTILLCGVAVANAQVVRLADVLNFLGWLLLAHMLWLVTRVLWVWKMTERQPAVAVA